MPAAPARNSRVSILSRSCSPRASVEGTVRTHHQTQFQVLCHTIMHATREARTSSAAFIERAPPPPFVHMQVSFSMAATVLLAGWGTKEGSRIKNWKRRFFILRTATAEETTASGCTHVLLYYKTQRQANAG
jgi:hypothetical protein